MDVPLLTIHLRLGKINEATLFCSSSQDSFTHFSAQKLPHSPILFQVEVLQQQTLPAFTYTVLLSHVIYRWITRLSSLLHY